MDSFEWNKIAGAILFALLVVFGLSIVSEIVFHTEAPETPGYVIAVSEDGEGGGEVATREPIGVLMASADAGAGESAARKCVACHTFAEGEPNKVGPNLWDTVTRAIASHEGYEYSSAMQEYAAEAEAWTFEHLDTYLLDPKGVVPGTKMVFPGLKNDSERANVIAYLRTLSANPAPLPEPPAEAEAAESEQEAQDASAETATEEETGEAEEPAEAAEPAAEEEQQGAAEAAPEEEVAAAPMEEQATEEEETATADTGSDEQAATEAPTEETADATEPAEEQQMAAADTSAAMPAGDVAKGETFARRCIACHSFNEGGANKVGPPLFGIVDRAVASLDDFAYSDAMKEFSESGTKAWDAETLDTYLLDPRGTVPGSKMIFPGIKGEDDRANLIAYLATLHP